MKKLTVVFLLLFIVCTLLGISCSNEKCTVSFYKENGDNVVKVQVAKDSLVNKPSDPIKIGYTFDGWTFEDKPFDFENTKITANIKLYAKWTANTYTITFDANGGECELPSMTVSYGEKVTPPTPVKESYLFLGWFLEGDIPFNFTTVNILKDVTLTAKWYLNEFYITYNLDGGTNNPKNVEKFSADVTVLLYSPTKTGYDFEGWYTNSNFDTKTFISFIPKGTTRNIELYAKWSKNNHSGRY